MSQFCSSVHVFLELRKESQVKIDFSNSLMTNSIFPVTGIQLLTFLFTCADQHILIGADEGIYTLNLNELHESTMELVSCCRQVSAVCALITDCW